MRLMSSKIWRQRANYGVWLLVVLCSVSLSRCQCVNVISTEQTEGRTEGGVEKSNAEGVAEAKKEPTQEAPFEQVEPIQDGSSPEEPARVENAPEAVVEEPTPEASVERTPEKNEPVPEKPMGSMIGTPCKSDADCGGMPLHCIKETDPPRFPFPNDSGKGPLDGYCTAPCYVGGQDCPSDAVCYVPGAASGSCLKRCQENKDCRTGYLCQSVDGVVKGCVPEPCSLMEPKGNYKVVLNSSRVLSGGVACSSSALPAGTSLNAGISLVGGQIKVEFGSKPGSLLPVTWSLLGTWSGLGMKFSAASSGGDGLLKGAFNTACLFYGQLEIADGGCRIEYDVLIYLP